MNHQVYLVPQVIKEESDHIRCHWSCREQGAVGNKVNLVIKVQLVPNQQKTISPLSAWVCHRSYQECLKNKEVCVHKAWVQVTRCTGDITFARAE